ncbi:MAG: glycosyltransferase family 2 protein [Cytophagaceae bacterium]|nr:glycosyltransferase family 2 protein [Cytophagaceae bacterium]MDW8456150.1 glycosyltransferase family 2 protein [Cytophagaceae bacterium]
MMLTIIIPVFNEEKTIIEVLKNILKIDFSNYFDSNEIIVVDDCSSDNSYELVKNFAKSHTNITLLRNESNKGKGYSIRKALQYAKGDVILFQDADLELSTDDIPSLIHNMFKLDADLVNGSRYLPGIVRPLSSFYRYLGNKIFTMITSFLLNVKITDIACGYKLVRKSLLDKLILKEDRFGFETELIIKALKVNKQKVAEVPVQYYQRSIKEGKKLRNSDAIKIFFNILKYAIKS